MGRRKKTDVLPEIEDDWDDEMRYVESRDAKFLTVNDTIPGQPRLKYAEYMAYLTIMRFGVNMPNDPMWVLHQMTQVNVYTYKQAARNMGMLYAKFQRLYGHLDGFSIRHTDKNGIQAWAVCYYPHKLHARERFTLAHELGHVILDHKGSSAAEEAEADWYAACFLVPQEILNHTRNATALARMCYVTRSMAARRLSMETAQLNLGTKTFMRMWWQTQQMAARLRTAYKAEFKAMVASKVLEPAIAEDINGTPSTVMTDLKGLDDSIIYDPRVDDMRDVHIFPPDICDLAFNPSVAVLWGLRRHFIEMEAQGIKVRRDAGERARKKAEEAALVCPLRGTCKRADRCVLDTTQTYTNPTYHSDLKLMQILNDYLDRQEGCPFVLALKENYYYDWILDGATELLFFPGVPAEAHRGARPKRTKAGAAEDDAEEEDDQE